MSRSQGEDMASRRRQRRNSEKGRRNTSGKAREGFKTSDWLDEEVAGNHRR